MMNFPPQVHGMPRFQRTLKHPHPLPRRPPAARHLPRNDASRLVVFRIPSTPTYGHLGTIVSRFHL